MSILIVVLISVAGLVLFWSPVTNPIFWRRRVAKRVLNDAIIFYQRGISIQNAHTQSINLWYDHFLKYGDKITRRLFAKMMEDEFPKQIKMLNLKIYGENYKAEYANIKNNEEMLEIIKSERAVSGGISGIEKMYLDKMIPLLNIENEEEILESIPHILIGFEEMSLPTTVEEIRVYLSECLGNKKVISAANTNELKEDSDHHSYAKEIQKHLRDLGCTLTTAGYVSAMALKHDRSALDQAISFCVGAITENYSKNLIQLMFDGHTHLTKTSDKIKNYYENGQISKLAYQSVISTLGSCLNPNKTDEEKAVLESLIKQNYLGSEMLVFINE